jgi:hypothetical protein
MKFLAPQDSIYIHVSWTFSQSTQRGELSAFELSQGHTNIMYTHSEIIHARANDLST